MTPEQFEYVKGELAKGITPDAIKEALRSNGYGEELIVQIFTSVDSGVPPVNAVSQPVVIQKEGPSVLKIVLIVIGVIVGLIIVIPLALATIVSSSLNSARDKGQDAATKSEVSILRATAEMHYDDNNNSYVGVCLETDPLVMDCVDDTETYRVFAKLTDGSLYCVDSAGFAGKIKDEPPLASCN
ncbi:MAG: hypothetical protein ACI92I_000194 [Acidimicrobiales bacterium]|jgi:hypothetical protein